ncbi:MAG: N-acetylneuraminate synthase family protein [Candidatus Microgenomates bacterium]|jgi:N-acetylneuraminate synthase
MDLRIGNKNISQNSSSFIVAEAGSNHDGNFNQALKLVDIAAEAGADAIKFQIFRADKLYPKNSGKIRLNNKTLDLYGFLKKHEVDYDWIPKLKKYCEERKIIFLATPFDERSSDILEKYGALAYKIASPELNHIPLLKHIAKKNKPIIMSDGLSTISDIDLAIETIKKQNNFKIAVLHCLSAYPAPAEEYNLNFIQTLIKVFGVIAGVSDHTTDPVLIPTLAVCNGARIVEKHFTISKNLKGADHFYALEPNELMLMIKKIREVEKFSQKQKKEFLSKHPKIMGSYEKIIAKCEKEIYPGDKRSIFAIKKIRFGERFTIRNIRVLRAERFLHPGIHPQFFEIILGKVCQSDISAFRGVEWKNVLKR